MKCIKCGCELNTSSRICFDCANNQIYGFNQASSNKIIQNKLLIFLELTCLILFLAISLYLFRPQLFSTKKYEKGEVVLLVTARCPYCQRAAAHLSQSGIVFKKLDVEKDPEGIKLYNENGRGGVPILIVNGDRILGYYIDRYNNIIKSLK